MQKPRKYTINDEIDHLVESMSSMEVGSEKYQKAAESLEKLCSARSFKDDKHISPDVIFSGVIAVIQILLVLDHERLNVVTSKAFGFIRAPKL